MRTTLFLAALVAVSTFSSVASAKGSACENASHAFLSGKEGETVPVIISEERDGGVSFLTDDSNFPIGELNGLLPHLEDQEQAVHYGNTNGAWAVLRKADGKMKVFYQSPNGCVEAFSN